MCSLAVRINAMFIKISWFKGIRIKFGTLYRIFTDIPSKVYENVDSFAKIFLRDVRIFSDSFATPLKLAYGPSCKFARGSSI